MDGNWLLWQLADSGLPTGGFVASSGLEAALQTGLVGTGSQAIRTFVSRSVHSYAAAALPFVTAAHQVCLETGMPGSGNSDSANDVSSLLDQIVDLDDLYEATTANSVARKASAAQGGALLALYTKSFRVSENDLVREDETDFENRQRRLRILTTLLDEFKAVARSGKAAGHVPICFGLLAGYLDLPRGEHELAFGHMFNGSELTELSMSALASFTPSFEPPWLGIPSDQTQTLFLFLYARSIVNAAVRLNALGPYLAQRVLADCQEDALKTWEKTKERKPDEARQTGPILELAQGLHGRLYSRLFSS